MERAYLDICAGRTRGGFASAARAALSAAEFPYTAAMQARNWLYDRGFLASRPLPRPAVSIGNLTTGGTGKTPLVCWLAGAARAAGRTPAVLLRGYKAFNETSDERMLIAEAQPDVVVVADPDRLRGAIEALDQEPGIDLFILDDAMQHRRVARQADIVLINAIEPWGFGHVLPRGLLREPLTGLRRAHGVVVTHAGQVPPQRLEEIATTVLRLNPDAPLFGADHAITGLAAGRDGSVLPMTALANQKYFIACGIAHPESFASGLARHGRQCVGRWFFPDHHPFTPQDVMALRRQAAEAGAAAIVVTEKDWLKLAAAGAVGAADTPFWRAQLSIQFVEDHEQRLLDLILRRTAR
jgi:tetraacyldisaccharide 4'-kinase